MVFIVTLQQVTVHALHLLEVSVSWQELPSHTCLFCLLFCLPFLQRMEAAEHNDNRVPVAVN